MNARPAEMRDFDSIMTVISQARAAIARLGIDQWQDGYPEPEVITGDIESGIGWVFEVEGKIASYMVPLADPEPIYDQLSGRWLQNDAPYLTVHPFRGRPNAPYLLPGTVRTVAQVTGRPLADVCAQVSAVAAHVYGEW